MKPVFLLFLFIASSFILQAQDSLMIKTIHEKAEVIVNKMDHELGLSIEQVGEIKGLAVRYLVNIDLVRNRSVDKVVLTKELGVAKKEKDVSIAAILSPGQFLIYQRHKEEQEIRLNQYMLKNSTYKKSKEDEELEF